jgi:hypothetical protein
MSQTYIRKHNMAPIHIIQQTFHAGFQHGRISHNQPFYSFPNYGG